MTHLKERRCVGAIRSPAHSFHPLRSQAHAASIGHVLAWLNADIAILQEVEGCFLLDALVSDDFVLRKAGYVPFLVAGTDTHLRQQIGVISKLGFDTPLRRSYELVPFP